MGRRGPSPDYAKREAFARLIAEGVPSARACRMVGINPRTGKRWRNGRRIPSGGRVLNLPPVITRHVLTIPRSGRKVHYRRCGQGPLLLMVHQSPRNSAEYERLMRDWGAHFTCIAPEKNNRLKLLDC